VSITFVKAPNNVYRIAGPDGIVEWRDLLGGRPEAFFHHPVNPYPGDGAEGYECDLNREYGIQGLCWPDAGSLMGERLDAWRSGDPELIRLAMHADYAETARDVQAARKILESTS
jgi:hypothetical protein